MKVLFCASEIFPFAKTGGLADVVAALPPALEKLGVSVKIVMPRYKGISFPKDTTTIGKNIEVHFIAGDKYFQRNNLYGTPQGDYSDNLERFSFFCRESLRWIKEERFQPDIIHLHDWQTGLIPLYLKTGLPKDPFYERIKTVFTIHNLAYQGVFPKEKFSATTLSPKLFNKNGLEWKGQINFLKGALLFADFLTTVSPTYSREIQTKGYGEGLAQILHRRRSSLSGIINGIDYEMWNPQSDKALERNFSKENLEGKAVNKCALQKEVGLKIDSEAPLVAFIGRLAYQKGGDLIAAAMAKMMTAGKIQFILLGTGEERYHRTFRDIARRWKENASINLKYDERLAHRIYAGSDLFLMPSRYEPCGLGQLIALRYGTIPLVRLTGGLRDTVLDYPSNKSRGYGFTFSRYSRDALARSLTRALAVYRRGAEWQALVKRAMEKEFSWMSSAQGYLKLYRKIAGKNEE